MLQTAVDTAHVQQVIYTSSAVALDNTAYPHHGSVCHERAIAVEGRTEVLHEHPAPWRIHGQGGGNVVGEHLSQASHHCRLVHKQWQCCSRLKISHPTGSADAEYTRDAPVFDLFDHHDGWCVQGS